MQCLKLTLALGLMVLGTASQAQDEASKSEYELFADWDTSTAFIDAHNKRLGIPVPVFLSQTDSRYQIVAADLAAIWPEVARQHPEVALLGMPAFVLTADAFPDATTYTDPLRSQVPWLLSVTAGSMLPAFSRDARQAVLAHELGHLVLKHSLDGRAYQSRVYYFASGATEEPLGRYAVDQPSARALGESWLASTLLVGDGALPELNGVPYNSRGGAIYQSLWANLVAKASGSGPLCQHLPTALRAYQEQVAKKGFPLGLNTDELNALDAKTQRLLSDLLSCEAIHGDLLSLADAEFWHVQVGLRRLIFGDLLTAALAADQVLFAEQGQSYAGLLAVTRKHQAILRAQTADPHFPDLRVYTFEDQADDFATDIMMRLGKPEALAANMLATIGFYDGQEGQQHCVDLIGQKKTPMPGSLINPHHSECYRAFQSLRTLTTTSLSFGNVYANH